MKYNPTYRVVIARKNSLSKFLPLSTIYTDYKEASKAAMEWMEKNWKSGYIATAVPMI